MCHSRARVEFVARNVRDAGIRGGIGEYLRMPTRPPVSCGRITPTYHSLGKPQTNQDKEFVVSIGLGEREWQRGLAN